MRIKKEKKNANVWPVIAVCDVVYPGSARRNLLAVSIFSFSLFSMYISNRATRRHRHPIDRVLIPSWALFFFHSTVFQVSVSFYYYIIHGGKGHLEWNTSHHNDTGGRKVAATGAAAAGCPISFFIPKEISSSHSFLLRGVREGGGGGGEHRQLPGNW